ncbi:hypothetical protein D3C78_1731760 [compost metagenome]
MQTQGRPGEQGAGGNLDQWQRQRNDPPDQTRNANQHQQDQDGVSSLHIAEISDSRQR